jgi:hypothetical protein
MTIIAESGLEVVLMAIGIVKEPSRRSPHGSIHSKIKVSLAYYLKMELRLTNPELLMTTYALRGLKRWRGPATVLM